MDPTTIPHAHSAQDLADDAEAARRRDGDLRRFAPAGDRGADGLPAGVVTVAAVVIGLPALCGIVISVCLWLAGVAP